VATASAPDDPTCWLIAGAKGTYSRSGKGVGFIAGRRGGGGKTGSGAAGDQDAVLAGFPTFASGGSDAQLNYLGWGGCQLSPGHGEDDVGTHLGRWTGGAPVASHNGFTPFVLFDSDGRALVMSPASNFFVGIHSTLMHTKYAAVPWMNEVKARCSNDGGNSLGQISANSAMECAGQTEAQHGGAFSFSADCGCCYSFRNCDKTEDGSHNYTHKWSTYRLETPGSAGLLQAGIKASVLSIPKGFVHETVLVAGHGLNDTLISFGDLLLAKSKKPRVDPYKDFVLSHLGHWNDAGAFYYHNPNPFPNYQAALLAVKADAEARKIPFRYSQWDDWCVACENNKHNALTCCVRMQVGLPEPRRFWGGWRCDELVANAQGIPNGYDRLARPAPVPLLQQLLGRQRLPAARRVRVEGGRAEARHPDGSQLLRCNLCEREQGRHEDVRARFLVLDQRFHEPDTAGCDIRNVVARWDERGGGRCQR
jgi:hypothetical protein